jgi:hypothetical protein
VVYLSVFFVSFCSFSLLRCVCVSHPDAPHFLIIVLRRVLLPCSFPFHLSFYSTSGESVDLGFFPKFKLPSSPLSRLFFLYCKLPPLILICASIFFIKTIKSKKTHLTLR